MTMNNRAAAHRMLKVRQDVPSLDDEPRPSSPTEEPQPTVSPSTPPVSTKPSTSAPTPTPTTRPPPPPPTTRTTSTTSPAPSSPSPTTTSSTSQSSSSSSSSVSLSSSSSVSRSTSSSSTITGATLIPATNSPLRPTSIVSPTITFTEELGAATESPTSTNPAASGGIKVGTVVGSIVGVLGAIAIIGLIVAFFLRRWRRRRGGDEDFDPAQFVRSPGMLDSGFRDSAAGSPAYRASTFDPTPPSMAQRGHMNTASISSGPGMAGHGAYTSASAMQQRPQYAYGNNEYNSGNARDDEGSDMGHGAYSSEPKPQNVYNPEAYGSYAYSTDGNHVVQQQSYHPYQAQQYYSDYRDTAPAPALVAGAPAVPAGRSARQSVAINDDDVYGGI